MTPYAHLAPRNRPRRYETPAIIAAIFGGAGLICREVGYLFPSSDRGVVLLELIAVVVFVLPASVTVFGLAAAHTLKALRVFPGWLIECLLGGIALWAAVKLLNHFANAGLTH